MRIDGEWFACDDGILRPVIRGEILAANGFWEPTPFLVDTGADLTVFSAAILEVLGFPPTPTQRNLGGVGGIAESVAVSTRIRFERDGGGRVVFRGEYAAFTQFETLDMSVLGRDILELFAVIVDRQRDVVSLLGQSHTYSIEELNG